jgi:hypothetical protein
MDADYLNWALADFSGSLALDEWYEGPFWVLSIVDNHPCKRLRYDVLDHDPDQRDIEAFLRRFAQVLAQLQLTVQGVTTEGSPLDPAPLRAVCGEVPPQICEFHILKELTKAVLRAGAQGRKRLAERQPPGKRGRPGPPAAQRAVRQRERLQQQSAALFEHRHLFGQHALTPTDRRTLHPIPLSNLVA